MTCRSFLHTDFSVQLLCAGLLQLPLFPSTLSDLLKHFYEYNRFSQQMLMLMWATTQQMYRCFDYHLCLFNEMQYLEITSYNLITYCPLTTI